MNVGDIVRLKTGHHLVEFIKGDCVITEVTKYTRYTHRRTRYHIKNSEDCMTWAYLEDLDLVSKLREDKLKQLGI